MTNHTHAIADYSDFEIHVKQAGKNEREFINKVNMLQTKYQRKEKMAEKGLISEAAGKQLSEDKTKDLAEAYAKHIIVNWKGKFQGKDLGKYSVEKCVELLADPENDLLFADLIEFSTNAANFTKEQEAAEIKN